MQFDAKREKDRIVQWIRDLYKDMPDYKAVVGISGGKDSSVVAALLVEALGKDRVIGVLMPQGEQKDIADSLQLVNHLGIKHKVINIGETVKTHIDVCARCGLYYNDMARTNLPAAIRMATLYSVAAVEKALVANTCNMSEDYIGYSTKFGDARGDFSPLADYTVTEVRLIGEVLGLPSNLVHKTPSDGLQPKTDEENLGFTYAVLDRYIREGICEDAATKANIDRRHKANLHKILPMPKCEYNPLPPTLDRVAPNK